MIRYQERFERRATVDSYEEEEYAPGSYASFIWELQQPVLRSMLARQRETCGRVRLLNFACGTGRILSFAESQVDQSDGVDRSAAMLERAARKCRTSRLLLGDIVTDPGLANERYDVITAFRFLLNAEDASGGRCCARSASASTRNPASWSPTFMAIRGRSGTLRWRLADGAYGRGMWPGPRRCWPSLGARLSRRCSPAPDSA